YLFTNNFCKPEILLSLTGTCSFLMYFAYAINKPTNAPTTAKPINRYSVVPNTCGCDAALFLITGFKNSFNQLFPGMLINPPTAANTAKIIKGKVITLGLSCK